ncbi:TPA: hypothetical protein H7W09_004465 [Escherichia coli]|nr:hypothetical protein [Escherichia coli]HBB8278350.1 hypothetical protein [Escherichia coli]HBB8993593.1 hypothetical protein [Escherichia coli]HBK0738329.1 hypothetical protein [Escherichia coli]HDQ1196520.1 hypothetical protein [Escherichia coli]
MNISNSQVNRLRHFVRAGLRSLFRPEPQTAVEWADANYYLPKESAYPKLAAAYPSGVIPDTAASAGAHAHTVGIGAHTHSVAIGSHGHTITVNAAGNAENTVKNIAFNYIVRLA